MLQLLEHFDKAPWPFVILTIFLALLVRAPKRLLTLVQTAQASQTLTLSEGMWQKVGQEIGYWLWLALCAALGYAAWVSYVLHLGPGRGWVVIGGLIPGIVATIILGVKPLDQPGKPGWLTAAAWIGLLYWVVATVVFLIYSLGQIKTDLQSSCELQSGGTLVGAVADSNARCVDYWLQRGTPASAAFAGEQPLLYVAAGESDVQILDLLLDSGHFNPNLPTADGDTPF